MTRAQIIDDLSAQLVGLKLDRDELARMLKECADRFERCCIHSGSDKEFAAAAVSDYRTALARVQS